MYQKSCEPGRKRHGYARNFGRTSSWTRKMASFNAGCGIAMPAIALAPTAGAVVNAVSMPVAALLCPQYYCVLGFTSATVGFNAGCGIAMPAIHPSNLWRGRGPSVSMPVAALLCPQLEIMAWIPATLFSFNAGCGIAMPAIWTPKRMRQLA